MLSSSNWLCRIGDSLTLVYAMSCSRLQTEVIFFSLCTLASLNLCLTIAPGADRQTSGNLSTRPLLVTLGGCSCPGQWEVQKLPLTNTCSMDEPLGRRGAALRGSIMESSVGDCSAAVPPTCCWVIGWPGQSQEEGEASVWNK